MTNKIAPSTGGAFFYYREFPVAHLKESGLFYRPDQNKIRTGLAKDIEEQGMINPLIVWNFGKWDHTIGTGNNRFNAIKVLGWEHAPCIIQGGSNLLGGDPVSQEDLPLYFRDGEPFFKDDGTLHLRGVTLPQSYTYPSARDASREWRHDVYRPSEPVAD